MVCSYYQISQCDKFGGYAMDAIKCIKTRRSVRLYTEQSIDQQIIPQILEAGISAPSGKNGQPWKFKIITDKNLICSVSKLSIYGSWMKKSPLFITVFLDNTCSYDRVKDVQSCGALMQTIMLAAHSIGIGSCWIGEILPQENSIKNILNINNDFLELMGIITLGYEEGRSFKSSRKNIESFIL